MADTPDAPLPPVPPPAKNGSGCLKITCGGCFALVALFCILSIVAWYYLLRWDSGSSFWDRLPPSTRWALETHGVNGILDHAFRDKGVRTLYEREGGIAARVRDELTRQGQGHLLLPFDEMRKKYDEVSEIFTAVFPNIVGVGAGGPEGDDLFFFLRLTTVFKWIGSIDDAARTATQRFERDGLREFHYRVLDGWLVASMSEAMVNEIADNWNSGTKPLGDISERMDAHISFGFVMPGAKPAAPSPAGAPIFGDPFAKAAAKAAGGAVVGPGAKGVAARFILRPREQSGWQVAGIVVRPGEGWGSEAVFANKSSLVGVPEAPLRGVPELRLAGRLTQEHRRAALERLDAVSGNPDPARDPAWKALGWLWFRKAWLENTGGDFMLAVGKPASRDRVDGVPPMPVASLGWSLARGKDPDAAAGDFATAVALWFEAMQSPGGFAPYEKLRKAVRYVPHDDGEGRGGQAEIPAVAANDMRPAWIFPKADDAGGWLATDPSGLPERREAGKFFGAAFLAGKEGRDAAVLGWDMTPEFLAAFKSVAEDRLAAVPESVLPDKDRVLAGIEFADEFLTAYPSGIANATAEEGTERVEVRAVF